MKTLFYFFCQLMVSATSFANIEAVIGSVPLKQNANLVALPSVPNQEVIISREQYVISYNKEKRSANWVAWKVTAGDLGSTDRSNRFEQDQELQQYLAAKDPHSPPAVTPADYKGSCFDRGHQAPSGDRTHSPVDNQATFMMSNMLPQTPYLNRFLWEQLERYTRQLVSEGKTAYVISGPVYDQNYGSIGSNGDIPVPSKMFKIIMYQDGDKRGTIAVMMPNMLRTGDAPTDKTSLCNDSGSPAKTQADDWQQYQSSVAEIEKATGLQLAAR